MLAHVPQGMEVYKTRNAALGKGARKFINGDFFKSDFLEDVSTEKGWDGTFDLLYDYRVLIPTVTFHPSTILILG